MYCNHLWYKDELEYFSEFLYDQFYALEANCVDNERTRYQKNYSLQNEIHAKKCGLCQMG
jgi:hypothetical protein